MLSKPALSMWRLLLKCEQEPDQSIAVKSLQFISPSAAHGRCTSQRCNKRHMFWHAKTKHFFFFSRGFFYFFGSARLITRLYGKPLKLQVSRERGKVRWFSHMSRNGEVGVFLLCVSRDTSFLSTAGFSGCAGDCAVASQPHV